jgi:NAD(P)-dependent dehydrogenase (short-subunit alcohol dehydrogenase family)
MNIENKTVLVTGSTDGVGRLVARRLADQGARVLIHGRDRTRGEQLLNKIRAADRGSAVLLPADFSSLAEVRRLARAIRQECDRLDILINNAGIGSGGSAGKRETSQDGYDCELPRRIPTHQGSALGQDQGIGKLRPANYEAWMLAEAAKRLKRRATAA